MTEIMSQPDRLLSLQQLIFWMLRQFNDMTLAKHCDLKVILRTYCIIIDNVILLCAASVECLCQAERVDVVNYQVFLYM